MFFNCSNFVQLSRLVTLIGPSALKQENQLLIFLFNWETLLFPRNLRSNKQYLAVLQRLSIRHLLPQLVRYNDLHTFYKIFKSLLFSQSYYIVTTSLQYKLFSILSSIKDKSYRDRLPQFVKKSWLVFSNSYPSPLLCK